MPDTDNKSFTALQLSKQGVIARKWLLANLPMPSRLPSLFQEREAIAPSLTIDDMDTSSVDMQ